MSNNLQTALEFFVAYGGLRVLENVTVFLLKDTKQKIGEKKYNKCLKVAEQSVEYAINVSKTLNAKPELEGLKNLAILKASKFLNIPSDELDKFVDLALDTFKDAIELSQMDNVGENKVVENTNTLASIPVTPVVNPNKPATIEVNNATQTIPTDTSNVTQVQ